VNYIATNQNVNKLGETPDQYYSVEVDLAGMTFPYQFKIRRIASRPMCFLIKESSDILPRLRVGDILEMKYYSSKSPYITEPRKTAIREITKDDQGQFKGHYLVALEILKELSEARSQESPKRLTEKEMFRKARELFRQGKYNEAIDIYTSIIQENPSQAVSYFNRGITYKKLGNNTKALKDLKVSATLGIEKARDFFHSKGFVSRFMLNPPFRRG